MADDMDSKMKGWEGWGDVQSGWQRGDGQREGAFVTVSKKGAVDASAETSQLLLEVAVERGLNKNGFVLDFKASVAKGQIACIPIPVQAATRSSAQVRWYEAAGLSTPRASFHVGGVFKDYPQLIPPSTVKCVVAKVIAPDGLPILVIPVKVGLGTQTTTRDDGSPGSQAAATKDQ
jgi:hypothetical protein